MELILKLPRILTLPLISIIYPGVGAIILIAISPFSFIANKDTGLTVKSGSDYGFPESILKMSFYCSIINVGSTFPTRDFLYVHDTVSGFIKTINSKKAIGEIINLGTGYEISIKILIKTISKILERKITIKEKKERKRPKRSEVQRLLASNTKAKKILNWEPSFRGKTGLIKALTETANWYKIEKNLKHFKTENFTD